MIEVEMTGDADPLKFKVTVREGSSQTRHQVTMARSTYLKLTNGKIKAEQCVRAAFQFLLDRESKESILRQFDVAVISEYFPSFDQEFNQYLRS